MTPRMLSPRHKRILFQVLPFGVIPAIFSVVYSLVEKGVMGDHPYFPSTGNPYEFRLIIPAVTSFLIGISIGAFEAFYVNRWFQKRSFSAKIAFKLVVYIIAIILATIIIVTLGHAFELGISPLDERVTRFLWAFFSSFAFWSVICYFSLAILCALFYAEVSNNIGQAVLLNFFTGKYHHPKEEERLYMFLDMKSSTTIAEQLGHIRYFELLKQYYADISDPVVEYGGQIYQYVGDEIVVTWVTQPGFADAALQCFFAMKEALAKQEDNYLEEFGVAPSFKAGIHFGEVTTGEIGTIKKDIAFSGDVLNTTARIQSLCNTYGVDLLVSEKVVEALGESQVFASKNRGRPSLGGGMRR
jgi:adenylate cyclase